ncbi:MAG: hypothetical protein EBZ91_14495, partial [Gammaproteobacteria bacterium]|nr:hypothetical protein [Gammaproteobacteria bacterium]
GYRAAEHGYRAAEHGYRASQFAPPALQGDGKLRQATFPQAVRTTVHVDSRDRDFARHPGSSAFVIQLPEALKNVSSAVLVSAELPLSYYVFSAARGNTSLTVGLNGTFRTVTVPDGNYTMASMASQLAALLAAAHPGVTFTVTFSDQTKRCTIAAQGWTVAVDATAAAKPTEWGLGYYLGFRAGVVTSGVNAVTGTYVATMNPENYLLIDIEELNGVGQPALYAGGGSGRRSFAKVPLNGDSYQYHYYDKTLSYVELRPQLTKLTSMRVSIRFHDGTLVDLNGGEWSMTLEFACTLARGL